MITFGLSECLRALEYSWNRIGSYTSVMILLILALGYLFFKNDGNEQKYLVYPGVFYLLVLLNPVAEWLLINPLGFESRVHRFFWVIPITFILAYVSLEIAKKSGKQGIFLIVFIIVLWCVQGRTPLEEEYYRTENIYKIENEIIELSEVMHKVDDEECFRVFINEIHPNYTIRQYDPAFLLIYDIREMDNIMSHHDLEKLSKEHAFTLYALAGYFYGHYQVDMDALYQYIKNIQIEYLILNYEEKEFVARKWIQLVAKTEHYYIYKVQ
jgi:hypothetical protein